jgi:glycosyltransferase involved in cell wall biosynthesis
MTTIALNMIVGPGESDLLLRCLESFGAGENFDEIVIVNTAPSDLKIDEVVNGFKNAKLIKQEWATEEFPHGNFARARNAALDATTSDYVMWLDADDALMEKYKDKLVKLLTEVRNPDKQEVDMYLIPYAIVVDQSGNAITTFMKDRIFKRTPIMRWRFAVHEQIRPREYGITYAKVNNIEVTHLPNKPSFASAERNIRILQAEYDKMEVKDPEVKYFLARDSMLSGKIDSGVELLDEMIQDMDGSFDSLYAVAMDLANMYAYGGITPRPVKDQIKPENFSIVMKYCRLAMGFCSFYAEPYVILGDVYWATGNRSGAEKLWLTAITKKVGLGNLQSIPYYEEIPADRLCDLYAERGQLEKALWYNSLALKNLPGCPMYIAKCKELLNHLNKKFEIKYVGKN